jgi:hypothetical protein
MTIDLHKNFFMGGNATFTVDNGRGTHYTFKIRQPKKDNPRFAGPAPHFASLLTGPDNENSYTYMGIVFEAPIFRTEVINPEDPASGTRKVDTGAKTMAVRLTGKSRYNDESVPVKVLRWALHLAATGGSLPEGYAVHHEGKCGCCGRTLTVPESIKRGIGPECWAKMGGL